MSLGLAVVAGAQGARFVRVQIILDGKVILEGNASDDGRRDADELWDALKSVRFKPTTEFHRLCVEADVQETVLKSTSPPGELANLTVEVAYGGTAVTNELHIKRVPVDAQGREWQLDSKDVTRLFDSRLISRSEAANLIDQKRKQ
jgi:hypothetical protein